MRVSIGILASCALAASLATPTAAADGSSGETRLSPLRAAHRYFSRSGKTSESATDRETATPSKAAPSKRPVPSPLTGAKPTRYQRRRSGGSASPTPAPLPTKNYYRELFGPNGAARSTTSKKAQPGHIRPVAHEVPAAVNPPSALRRIPDTPAPAASATATAPPFPTELDQPQGVIHAAFDEQRDAGVDGGVVPVSGKKPHRPESDNVPHVTPAADAASLPKKDTRVRTATLETASPKPEPARPVSFSKPATLPGNLDLADDSGAPAFSMPRVSVRWIKRSEIHVGRECQLELLVRNDSRQDAGGVAVEAYFPSSVRLTAAEPKPDEATDHLTWNLDRLAAGEEARILVSLIPSRRGELATRALVRVSGTAESLFNVEEPLLKIALSGPKEVVLGDPASQFVTVSNPGTGTARDVVVEARIPKGLEHPRGERLQMEIGSLEPGESRTIRLALAAVEGGQHAVTVQATSGTDVRAEAASEIAVLAPHLTVNLSGPSRRYKGRNARYELTVLNDGAVPTENVRVQHILPAGFELVEADGGAKYNRANRTLHWYLGRLEPNRPVRLSVQLASVGLGEQVHRVRAVSENGAAAESELLTRVEGTASLVLELADLADPVEVGEGAVYEIRVRNEGSVAAKNVGLSCELPAGTELVEATSPGGHFEDGGLIVFKPVTALPAGKTAVYRLTVKGSDEGNKRLRARLSSDSIQEPLIAEELTRFYKD